MYRSRPRLRGPEAGVTKRAGVIGHPLGHSVSPALFQAAFASAGIDATYEAWDTPPDTLEGRVNSLRAADFLGANVTVPHKTEIVQLLDGADDVAAKAGAVNTVVHRDGKLTGYNTDVAGFARSLREDAGFDAKGKRVTLLGSGGAARAVALALIDAGASVIYVVARTPRKIDRMVVDLKPRTTTGTTITWAYWGDGSFLRSLDEADLLVNCTPLGTKGGDDDGKPVIDPALIHPKMTVFDLVYNPAETPLLAAAKSRGAKGVSGLGMLVYQAAESFRLWTGAEADTKAMMHAGRKALES
jgi:shikimate dehydrogenase